uniref:Uncharacterized protein n=1 Tax=Anguilla anguilla TaxID=7936 RepID=A0A0E9SJB1_ANGAN
MYHLGYILFIMQFFFLQFYRTNQTCAVGKNLHENMCGLINAFMKMQINL